MNITVSRPRHAGFTLVESMMTLLVLAVIVVGVIPSMMQLIAGARVSTEVNSLISHLQLARSEAVTRGYRAVLCSSADGSRCLGSRDWGLGYMVFIDKDGDRKRDSDEPVVHFRAVDGEGVVLDAGRRKTVAYQPSGWAPGSNLTFTVCDSGSRVSPKAVVVSDTGRPRVADLHPNGTALSCS